MPFISASVDTLTLGVIVCLVVFAYRGTTPAVAKHARPPKHRLFTTVILAVHTIYMAYILSFDTPSNLFAQLHLPLSMSPQRVRAILLARGETGGVDALPEHIEELLTRLSTFDLKVYFVRFGQNAIQECEWCTTFAEYAVYTLSAIVLSYLKEAALLGVVTTRGTGRESWRSTTIGGLTLACIADVYWMLTVRITVDQPDVTMWYDTLWIIRHAFFIALPLVTHFALPPSFTPSPLAIVPQTSFALQALHRRVQLLKLTSVITLRVPEFRQAAGNYWETQRMEGKWVREDQAVNRLSEKTGRGMTREMAREVASKFKHGFDL